MEASNSISSQIDRFAVLRSMKTLEVSELLTGLMGPDGAPICMSWSLETTDYCPTGKVLMVAAQIQHAARPSKLLCIGPAAVRQIPTTRLQLSL